MPRGVFNWTFRDVVDFLREHGFQLRHVQGSHYYYGGHVGGQFRLVSIPFHGAKVLKPRTFNGIVRQSGIAKREWLGGTSG